SHHVLVLLIRIPPRRATRLGQRRRAALWTIRPPPRSVRRARGYPVEAAARPLRRDVRRGVVRVEPPEHAVQRPVLQRQHHDGLDLRHRWVHCTLRSCDTGRVVRLAQPYEVNGRVGGAATPVGAEGMIARAALCVVEYGEADAGGGTEGETEEEDLSERLNKPLQKNYP